MTLTNTHADWLNGHKYPNTDTSNLVESLPRRVAAVIAANGVQLHINAHGFRMGCQQQAHIGVMSSYEH